MLRKHAYTIGGTAASAVLTLATAPYWALDVGVLTFSSLAILQYCIRKMEFPSWLRTRRPEVTSRVFSYSQVFKETRKGNTLNYVLRSDRSFFQSVKPPNLSMVELAELESRMKAAE